jgi:hypothetical protein
MDMDTDSHTELGWMWLSVFCSVHGESVFEYITEVKPQRRFHDIWVVKIRFVKEILVRPMRGSAT